MNEYTTNASLKRASSDDKITMENENVKRIKTAPSDLRVAEPSCPRPQSSHEISPSTALIHSPFPDYYSSLLSEVDECHDLTEDLESGTHRLIFEFSQSSRSKCRALQCLVQHHCESNVTIQSRYRLLVEAVDPRDYWTTFQQGIPNKRYYHVSCLEHIGVDIATHGWVSCAGRFHPALVDWFHKDGMAFDAASYETFIETIETHAANIRLLNYTHLVRCIGSDCQCAAIPAEPKSEDYIDGIPTKRSLTDVLLDIMGASHLTSQLSLRSRLMLLEIRGSLPEELTKAALATKEDSMSVEKRQEVPEGEVPEGEVGVDQENVGSVPLREVQSSESRQGSTEESQRVVQYGDGTASEEVEEWPEAVAGKSHRESPELGIVDSGSV